MTSTMTTREIVAESESILKELLRCDFGIPFLDDGLLGMAPGEITLVGARSGGGKTEFATQVLLEQQSEESDRMRSTLYFALDHDKGEIERRVMWRLLVQQIYQVKDHPLHGKPLRYASWMAGKYRDSLRELESDTRLYYEHLFAVSETSFLYRKGQMTATDIGEIISSAEQYNLFIVDHFHSIRGIDSIEKQSEAIFEISKAAEKAHRPVLILGQFRKRSPTNKSPIPEMEEFSGSSQLIYLPQNIVVLAPRFLKGSTKYETYFHIVKSRTASDTTSFVGVHSFDNETKKYSKKYELMRYVPFSEPEELLPIQTPKWSTNILSSVPSATHPPPSSRQSLKGRSLPYKED